MENAADATDYWDRPILVTGLPRSGTSLIAGLLAESGAWVGKTVPGGPPNPRGFFEHIALREGVVKSILRVLECDPLGVRRLPELDTLPPVDNLRETVHQLLRREGYDGRRPWLFKDAKLTLLWPQWAAAFPQARWVIVRRDIEAVIDSCLRTHFMAWHGLDRHRWRQWAEAYLERLRRLKASVPWAREIHPHTLVAGDWSPFLGLAETLGLEPEPQRLHRFLLPERWHQSQRGNVNPVKKP